MTHFLARLVDRVRDTAPRVEPIIASRYVSPPLSETSAEIESPSSRSEQVVSERGIARDSPATPPVEAETRRTEPAGPGEADIESDQQLVGEKFRPAREVDARRVPEPSRAMRTNWKSPQSPSASRLRPSVRGSHVSEEPEREPPVVRVTIGRIEVRAAPLAAPPVRKPARHTEPALTLDAYLKARKEGTP